MTRVLLLGFVSLAVACGGKTFPSLCANQVPPPAACSTACDPAPGAVNACPSGYHCSADGKCDAVCTLTGGQCGSDYHCTADGHCVPNGNGSGSGTDMDACPSVHVAATKTTPTVELLLDQSGSMTAAYGNTDRWNAMRNALIDPTNGVVKKLADKVVFGVTLYTGLSTNNSRTTIPPCPRLTTQARALNNFTAIQTLLQNSNPVDDTPTGESIDAVVADFKANPPMQGSPPIIVLATDGLPDSCQDANPPDATAQAITNAGSVAAAQRAYTAGVKLFFLFVGDDQAGDHPQKMANAGAGLDPDTGKAKFYVATDPAQLTQAFNDIVGGVLSCDLKLNGQVDPIEAQTGVVTLNGNMLTYGTDWNVDNDGVTLHILGNACTTLKATSNSTVDAVFACGTVIF